MYLTENQLERYKETIRKTTEWVLNNPEKIRAEPDLQGHYKAPYLWAAVGNMDMAGQCRRLIVERFLRKDGDFRTEEDFKGFRGFPCSPPNQYIYSNGWIITGMQKVGAYDIANKGLAFILRFQDPNHGGFYFSFDAKKKKIDTRLMDSSSTASAGLACLACGRLEEAKRGGDFLVRLLELQPEPDRHFYSCMKPDGTLQTDVFGNENQWDPDSRKQKCLSAEHDGMKELTWLIGKPTKFLAKLYAATGEDRYLAGARQAFDFFHKLDRGAWTNYASCKTMWAGSELYRITGEKVFAETAVRILDYFSESQSTEGSWVHSLWYRDESEQPLADTMDITQEFGAEISDVVYDFCSCE
jgi:hypothetical protein